MARPPAPGVPRPDAGLCPPLPAAAAVRWPLWAGGMVLALAGLVGIAGIGMVAWSRMTATNSGEGVALSTVDANESTLAGGLPEPVEQRQRPASMSDTEPGSTPDVASRADGAASTAQGTSAADLPPDGASSAPSDSTVPGEDSASESAANPSPRPLPDSRDALADVRLREYRLPLPSPLGLPTGDNRSRLVAIDVDNPADCDLELVGVALLFGSLDAVRLEVTDEDNVRNWTATAKVGEGRPEKLATFQLADKQLSFAWEVGANGDQAARLGYCLLEIRVAGDLARCQLSSPLVATPLGLAQRQTDLSLKNLPVPHQRLLLELAADGLRPHRFEPSATLKHGESARLQFVGGPGLAARPRFNLEVQFQFDAVAASLTLELFAVIDENRWPVSTRREWIRFVSEYGKEGEEIADRYRLVEFEQGELQVAELQLRRARNQADFTQRQQIDADLARLAALQQANAGLAAELEQRYQNHKQGKDQLKVLSEQLLAIQKDGKLHWRVYLQVADQQVNILSSFR